MQLDEVNRVGEVIVCKRDNHVANFGFKKGDTYYILCDVGYGIFISHHKNFNMGDWFYFRVGTRHYTNCYNFFYTKKELRKLKLDEIKRR